MKIPPLQLIVALLLIALGGCTGGLSPGDGDGGAGGGIDLAGADLVTPIPCTQGMTCAAGQVCVIPSCCPPCTFVTVDYCPKGTSMRRCPSGGGMACVGTCTPPEPHCGVIPQGCTDAVPCRCLDVKSACGFTGGCAGTISGQGQALFCNECN